MFNEDDEACEAEASDEATMVHAPTNGIPRPQAMQEAQPARDATPELDATSFDADHASELEPRGGGTLMMSPADNPAVLAIAAARAQAASVTFAADGTVSNVALEPPYAGTNEGSCVTSQFRRAKVNPFNGAPHTVRHAFEVPK